MVPERFSERFALEAALGASASGTIYRMRISKTSVKIYFFRKSFPISLFKQTRKEIWPGREKRP